MENKNIVEEVVVAEEAPVVVAEEAPVVVAEEAPVVIEEIITKIKSEFILIIESVIESTEKQDKYKSQIVLDEDMKTMIQKQLLKNELVFDSIEQTMKSIVKYNSIDSKDIPCLMLLLAELYECSFQIKNNLIIGELCGKVLKFCISVLILENLIEVHDQVEVLSNIKTLIDVGVNLIKLNKDLKTKAKLNAKINIFEMLKMLFGLK